MISNTLTMIRIRDIVEETLLTGYLSIEAENQLRELLTNHYEREDFHAFMKLQEAAVNGNIQQESRLRCGLK
jgi:thioredoxin-like negative regulator of GroEL